MPGFLSPSMVVRLRHSIPSAGRILPPRCFRRRSSASARPRCACSLTCFHTTVVCPRPSTTTTRIAVTSSPIRGYVYRNGRLMAWGDWFRLVPKGEATKLARVQIDFPNSLDEAWTIDIKKSRARPPHGVRERLRQIINRITARSVTVHRGVGRSSFRRAKPRSGSATPITAASVSQSTSSTRSSHPWAQDFRPRMWICFVSCWIRLPPPYRWR